MQKTFSQNEIPEVAREVLHFLTPHTTNQTATIAALSGDLGAGKTTLSQAIARELGVKENVISPTFVIMKIYELTGKKWKHLIHIDAYRLESGTEIQKLGWQEMIADPKNLILIEWPEKVADVMPPNAHKISLMHKGDDMRHITLSID